MPRDPLGPAVLIPAEHPPPSLLSSEGGIKNKGGTKDRASSYEDAYMYTYTPSFMLRWPFFLSKLVVFITTANKDLCTTYDLPPFCT